MHTQTRTQKMALAAFQAVERRHKTDIEAEYRTLALNFPSMILQSGLTQAIGFMLAKGKEEHQAYLDDLVEVLADSTVKSRADLHQKILTAPVRDYQLLTRVLLDASSWLKRYTQALLEKDSTK